MYARNNLPYKNDVEQWTVETVSAWLRQIELQDCSAVFLRAGVDGHKMLNLTEMDLLSFGILPSDSRKKIYQICQDIKRGYSQPRTILREDVENQESNSIPKQKLKTKDRRLGSSLLDDDLYLLPISINCIGELPPPTPARPDSTLDDDADDEKDYVSITSGRLSPVASTTSLSSKSNLFWGHKSPPDLPPRTNVEPKKTFSISSGNNSISKTRNVEEEEYYFDITRERAREILINGCQGDFLIRPSKRSDDHKYTLCIQNRNSITNLPIREKPNKKYTLGSKKANGEIFNSIQELVERYKREPLTIANKASCLLGNPPVVIP